MSVVLERKWEAEERVELSVYRLAMVRDVVERRLVVVWLGERGWLMGRIGESELMRKSDASYLCCLIRVSTP
jgi:hypothetical protein